MEAPHGAQSTPPDAGANPPLEWCPFNRGGGKYRSGNGRSSSELLGFTSEQKEEFYPSLQDPKPEIEELVIDSGNEEIDCDSKED